MFTAAHEAFWAAARKTDGDARGTKALIDVLLLHRSMTAEDVTAGITAALTVGAVTADVVAVEARRHEAMGGSSLGRPLDANRTSTPPPSRRRPYTWPALHRESSLGPLEGIGEGRPCCNRMLGREGR